MMHYVEGEKNEMFDFQIHAFMQKEFPEYIARVYKNKEPKQVSSQKMKKILELFNNEYELIYWTASYSFPNNTYLEEVPEIVWIDCEFDENLVIKTIADKNKLDFEVAKQLFKDSKSYFINLYYGDSITYNYVAIKKS